MKRITLLLTALLGLLAPPTRGVAQPAPTDDARLYAEALELYRRGDRRGALEKTRAAYQSQPRSQYLLFVSRLQEELGQFEESHQSCALYLRKYANAEREAEAQECATRTQAVLDQLKPEIKLTSTPPGARVTLDGLLQEGATPWSTRVDTGPHEIKLQLDGYSEVKARLQVNATGEHAWDYTLVPLDAPARLRFKLEAPGLDTLLNGEPLSSGAINETRTVPPGVYTIRFTCLSRVQESVLTLPPNGEQLVRTPKSLVADGCESRDHSTLGWVAVGLGAASAGAGVALGLAASEQEESMTPALAAGGIGAALVGAGLWLLLDER